MKVFNVYVSLAGDMELVLGTNTNRTAFLVSSHNLCSASPVLRGMLSADAQQFEQYRQHSPYLAYHTTRRPGDLYKLAIQDDDPTALAVVLFAMHSRMEYIPKTVSFDNLVQLASVCAHYDCAVVLQPWLAVWAGPLKKTVGQAGFEDWLLIAWVFCIEDVFKRLTRKFATEGVGADRFKVVREIEGTRETVSLHPRLPQAIIGTWPLKFSFALTHANEASMYEQRSTAFQQIRETCQNLYNLCEDKTTMKCKHPGRLDQTQCDYIMFASLHQEFKGLHLLNDQPPDIHAQTYLLDLIRNLRRIKTFDMMSGKGPKPYEPHKCSPIEGLSKRLDMILLEIKPLDIRSFFRGGTVVTFDQDSWDQILPTCSLQMPQEAIPSLKQEAA
jgi:hypothetical protein